MTVPEIHLDRLPEVIAARGTGRSLLYHDITKGVWPEPVRIGRASCWPRHETQELLRARIAGATDDQMRELVRKLHAQRSALMPALGVEAA